MLKFRVKKCPATSFLHVCYHPLHFDNNDRDWQLLIVVVQINSSVDVLHEKERQSQSFTKNTDQCWWAPHLSWHVWSVDCHITLSIIISCWRVCDTDAFVSDSRLTTGANNHITALIKIFFAQLRLIQETHPEGRFPSEIVIQLDNTVKENKNNFMHFWFGILCLRWLPGLMKVIFKYNLKGHTHSPVDGILHQISASFLRYWKGDPHQGLWILDDIPKAFEKERENGQGMVVPNIPAVASFMSWVC